MSELMECASPVAHLPWSSADKYPQDSSPLVVAGDDELRGALALTKGRATSDGRVFLPSIAERVFAAAARRQAAHPMLQLCYSVKTNPSTKLLSLAKSSGLLAEVISPDEVQRALLCGFDRSEIVYNGPYPAQYCSDAPGYVFADSIEAFASAAGRFSAAMGIRLRPRSVRSRFGIPLERIAQLAHTVRTLRIDELGVSFHVRPQDYGDSTFRDVAGEVVDYAEELQARSGARVTRFDVGGGRRPHEFDDFFEGGDFLWLASLLSKRLQHLRTIFAEPGQALATATEAVTAAVLERRERSVDGAEIVVDAGYPELPQLGTFEHRIFAMADEVRRLQPGDGRIVGRTCLEYDVIADGVDLRNVRVGEAIAIADAGAYDSSMHFEFARGDRCR